MAVVAGSEPAGADGLEAADVVLEVSHPALSPYLPEAHQAVLASAIGPVLLAWCVDATGSYAVMFRVLAAVVAIAALAADAFAGSPSLSSTMSFSAR